MGPLDAPPEQLTALHEGRAFADLSTLRTVRVTGGDARAWLHDLVTTDVASLAPGHARRSLLLTPTGRIRADFMVGHDDDGFLLLQHADQPHHIGSLLEPYVLSSDVEISDHSEDLVTFASLGRTTVQGAPAGLTPSIVGSGPGSGEDIVVPRGEPASRIRAAFASLGLIEAGWDALEVWRIRRGTPRMGPDFDEGSLPAEAGLEATIDTTKGCFLGQESVAKIRNLGHPPTVLRSVRARSPVGPGTPIVAEGVAEAGLVTSAAVGLDGVGTDAIARLRWAADGAALRTADGAELVPVGSAD